MEGAANRCVEVGQATADNSKVSSLHLALAPGIEPMLAGAGTFTVSPHWPPSVVLILYYVCLLKLISNLLFETRKLRKALDEQQRDCIHHPEAEFCNPKRNPSFRA